MSARRATRASRALVVVLAIASSHGVATAAEALPARVVQALNAKFPGWRFARVRADVASRLSAGDSPRWIAGDFDGDGRRDHAVQIVRPGAPPDAVQAVVVTLARTGQATVIYATPESDIAYLRLARRGERVPDLDADAAGRRTVRLTNDAVHILFAEAAGVTCAWRRDAFRCFVSGD